VQAEYSIKHASLPLEQTQKATANVLLIICYKYKGKQTNKQNKEAASNIFIENLIADRS